MNNLVTTRQRTHGGAFGGLPDAQFGLSQNHQVGEITELCWTNDTLRKLALLVQHQNLDDLWLFIFGMHGQLNWIMQIQTTCSRSQSLPGSIFEVNVIADTRKIAMLRYWQKDRHLNCNLNIGYGK